jgi:hypothetical protein
MKSTSGGVAWAPSAVLPAIGAMNIVDLAVSPNYATDSTVVVVAAPAAAAAATSQVYISTNGGASFAVLGGTIAGLAKSIAISPDYNNGVGEIMVGTTDANNAAATYGDVYFWGRAGTLNWQTATAGLAEDVTKVAYSPNFPIDGARMAVGSTVASGTRVHTLIANDAGWDVSLATVAVINAAVQGTGDGAAVAIASSTLAIPSDFNASSLFNRTLYAGTISGGAAIADNVYRLAVGSPSAAVALNPLAIFAIADQTMSSLEYVGTAASGTLLAGYSAAMFVMSAGNAGTATAAVPPTWMPSVTGPTGGTMIYLAPDPDFATSGKLYASTIGAESALSISDDGGAFFYQAGMVDTATVGLVVDDFQVAGPSEFFMVQSNGATVSVWKTTDAGATWYRRLAVASALTGILRLSPTYTTDATAYFGLVTSAAANNVRVTNNSGASWTGRNCNIAVGDMAVKDQYTAYVSLSGAGGTVTSTVNGGWTWQAIPTVTVAAQAITDIKYDVDTGHILVGLNNGAVMMSTNSNVSYLPVGGVGIGGTNTIVAFDADYANNSFVYAGSAAGAIADVLRCQVGTYTAWLACGSAVPAAGVRDLLAAPDGTLYVADVTAAAGLSRSINPTAGFATLSLATWDNAVGAGLAANSTITILARAEGSNVIYGYDAANGLMYTYTDTLCDVPPNPLSPMGGPVLDAAANIVMFTWEAVPGALSYRVRYDTRDDFLTATTTAAATDPAAPRTAFIIAAGVLANGFDYNWQVRVQTPVVGPWCDAQTFTTQLAAAALNAPAIIGAVEGGTAAGGWDANINPNFQWGAIANATAYEFQLATDAAFTDLVVDASGANALGVVTAYKPDVTLDYNTTYYWRVRALSTTTNTDWTAATAFTTMAAPVVAPEPVVIEQTPAPVINIPEAPPAQEIVIPPPPAAEQIAPGYIWAIIIIGAVLVIAVIVLIVRTRRQV